MLNREARCESLAWADVPGTVEAWDRYLVTRAKAAKRTEQTINCQRIYPPLNRNRADILAAANPVV
jgi:hypothetical protein